MSPDAILGGRNGVTDERITLHDLFAAAALASGKHHSDDGIVDRGGL